MARIVTTEQMRTYIKMMLGGGIVNVEMKNEVLNQIIEDSIQEFQKYNYGEGQYLDYVIFTASAGQTTYNFFEDPVLSASWEDISNVVNFEISFGINGINTLFSPTHILLMENGQANNMLGGSRLFGGQYTPGLELTSYKIAMMYLQDIQETLGKQYMVNWIPYRGTLVITPAPKENVTGILQLYRKEKIENLLNDNLVKKLCVAKTKIVWGQLLRKYNMSMPGGGTINGDLLHQEGVDEEEKILEQIRLESEPCSEVFFG